MNWIKRNEIISYSVIAVLLYALYLDKGAKVWYYITFFVVIKGLMFFNKWARLKLKVWEVTPIGKDDRFLVWLKKKYGHGR